MKKKTFKRLHLRRETLLNLQEPALSALLLAGGAATNYTEKNGYEICCSTVTSPPIVPSGYCESRPSVCGSGGTGQG